MRRLMVAEMLMRCLTRYNRDGKTYTKKRTRDRAWNVAKDSEDIQIQTCERCVPESADGHEKTNNVIQNM